jgi:hypothetical protein
MTPAGACSRSPAPRPSSQSSPEPSRLLAPAACDLLPPTPTGQAIREWIPDDDADPVASCCRAPLHAEAWDHFRVHSFFSGHFSAKFAVQFPSQNLPIPVLTGHGAAGAKAMA